MASYDIDIPDPLIACSVEQVDDKLYPTITVDEHEVWRGAARPYADGWYVTEGRATEHLQKVLGKLLASIPEDES